MILGVLAASLLYSVAKPCGSLVAFFSFMLQFSHFYDENEDTTELCDTIFYVISIAHLS